MPNWDIKRTLLTALLDQYDQQFDDAAFFELLKILANESNIHIEKAKDGYNGDAPLYYILESRIHNFKRNEAVQNLFYSWYHLLHHQTLPQSGVIQSLPTFIILLMTCIGLIFCIFNSNILKLRWSVLRFLRLNGQEFFPVRFNSLANEYVISNEAIELADNIVEVAFQSLDACIRYGDELCMLFYLANNKNGLVKTSMTHAEVTKMWQVDHMITCSDSCLSWLERNCFHIFVAICRSKARFCEVLSDIKADNLKMLSKSRDLHGRMPVHIAALYKQMDIMQLLLEMSGTAGDNTDIFGCSPLNLLARKSNVEILSECKTSIISTDTDLQHIKICQQLSFSTIFR